jgi:polyisoprenoid-binding protein YceI
VLYAFILASSAFAMEFTWNTEREDIRFAGRKHQNSRLSRGVDLVVITGISTLEPTIVFNKSRLRAAAVIAALVVFAPSATLINAQTPAQVRTFTADPGHSFVSWVVKNRDVAYVQGRFDQLQGTIAFAAGDPASTTIDIAVAANSVSTGSQGRDAHLKNQDFFAADQNPTIEFHGKGVTTVSEGTYDMNGNLTMLGVTKPLTIRFTHTGSVDMPKQNQSMIGGYCTFTIKRSDYGMNFMVGKGIADEVTVSVSIQAAAPMQ